MNRRMLAVCAAAALVAAAPGAYVAATPGAYATRLARIDGAPGDDDWKYDVVHLKAGGTVSGLVVEQDAHHVFIRTIVRKPGAPTLIFSDDYNRSLVDHIDLLSDEDRASLAGASTP